MASLTISRPRYYAHTLYWSIIDLDWIAGTQPGGGTGGAGDASAANQLLGNASLVSIEAKTPALGQALAALSTPVVLTALQQTALTPPAAITGFATETTLDTRLGALIEAAPGSDTASSGLNGRLQRIAQRITSLITALGSPFQAGGSIGNTAFIANAGTNLNTSALSLEATQLLVKARTDNIPPVGQALAAASTPVVLTAIQQAALTPPAAITGFSTEATLDARTGILTEAAPGSDTASSGINGRLQRIAQRLTSLIALLPTALIANRLDVNNGSWMGSTAATVGSKTSANSIPVVVASDQGAVPVSGTVTVTPPALTKGTQGATGFSTQDLKDAGRNQTNYYMVIQIVTTATDALLALTGYKGGILVAATTTPAVVTANKTYRINSITLEYTSIVTTEGSVRFTLRANTGGVVAIGSPVVCVWEVGQPGTGVSVAGKKNTITIPFPDGLEFAAGTGIGISQVGLSPVGAAAIAGYGRATINGYEY